MKTILPKCGTCTHVDETPTRWLKLGLLGWINVTPWRSGWGKDCWGLWLDKTNGQIAFDQCPEIDE